MTGPRRVLNAFSIASIALLASSGAALVVSTSASAAPAVGAQTCGYPPGACTITTNQGVYQPGQTVRFHTRTHSFARNEAVGVTISGPHNYHRGYTSRSGPQGGFALNVKLAEKIKAGNYKIGLTGRHDGHHVTGNFKVS